MGDKMTKEQLALENKRLKALLTTWEPPQVAENLRREIARLKEEQNSREWSKFNVVVDVLEATAKEFGRELKGYKNFQARRDAGIIGKAKRVFRHLMRYDNGN